MCPSVRFAEIQVCEGNPCNFTGLVPHIGWVPRAWNGRPGGGEGVAQARKLHQMLQLFNERIPCTYFGRVICADVAEFISAAV